MAGRGQYAKGIAKRREILEVALEVFSQNGYDRTSVREIARRTGLSQAGLLHYFSSKEELFSEVLRRRDERAEQLYNESEGPVTIAGFLSIVRHNVDQAGLVRLYVAMSAESTRVGATSRDFFEQRFRVLGEHLAADARRLQDRGQLGKHLDPEVVASLLIAAADGLQVQWLLDPDGVDMGARLEELWDFIRGSAD